MQRNDTSYLLTSVQPVLDLRRSQQEVAGGMATYKYLHGHVTGSRVLVLVGIEHVSVHARSDESGASSTGGGPLRAATNDHDYFFPKGLDNKAIRVPYSVNNLHDRF